MTRTRRTVTGLGLVVLGAVLGMLALTALPWFRGSLGGFLAAGSRPSDLRRTISFYRGVPDIGNAISFGVAPVYFSWLALVLLIVAAIGAAATVGFDPRASRLVAVLAAAVSVVGLVLTALAIKLVDVDRGRLPVTANPPGYGDYLGHTGIGAWAMALGFLLVAAGALVAAGGRDSFRQFLADEPDPPPAPDEPSAPHDPSAPASDAATPAPPTGAADVPPRRPRENW